MLDAIVDTKGGYYVAVAVLLPKTTLSAVRHV